MKAFDDLKEILEDQMKRITKKGDITPQELESMYKAVDIIKDMQTIKAMEKAEEEYGGNSNGYSRQGQGANAVNGGASNDYSNHWPYYSYAPVWNQSQPENPMMRGESNRGSYAGRAGRDGDGDGRYSETGSYNGGYDGSYAPYDGSYRRGRDARTGRYVSRDRGSYEYSRHTEKERMLGKLESMMDDAKTEKERSAIAQCIDKLED